jgi:hypothetical protein
VLCCAEFIPTGGQPTLSMVQGEPFVTRAEPAQFGGFLSTTPPAYSRSSDKWKHTFKVKTAGFYEIKIIGCTHAKCGRVDFELDGVELTDEVRCVCVWV